jgi:hypothetical protein
MPNCLICSQTPCTCTCFNCGVAKQFTHTQDSEGKFIPVSNLTLDSIPMKDSVVEPKLAKLGWRHIETLQKHFRFRVTCRACHGLFQDAREVWRAIDKERKAKDSDAPTDDSFYGTLVGAEGEGDSSYYRNFTD